MEINYYVNSVYISRDVYPFHIKSKNDPTMTLPETLSGHTPCKLSFVYNTLKSKIRICQACAALASYM